MGFGADGEPQIPIMGDPSRIQVHEYPGGHMYYARTASSLALRGCDRDGCFEALSPVCRTGPLRVGRPLSVACIPSWRLNHSGALALLGKLNPTNGRTIAGWIA